VTRAFIAPANTYAHGHRGIDLAARTGDPVYAPADGVVSFAGVVVDRPVLSVAHAGDLISSVEPVEALVTAGEHVTAGQRIGLVGAGGHCVGVCVHFGVRLHGHYVSPLLYLGGVPRAVLLPVGDGASPRSPASGPRVGGSVGLFESLGGDVGVDLGRAQAGMAE
jgi:murein DD-endopeptidase MepM/ murein hydrolase activator NlpD